MTNKEFAEELARAQAGTNLEKKQQPSKKERRAQKAASNQKDANVSTDTASNADDDMSPIATPPSGANSTAATSRAGGVEDMLEPAASKATTMRITNVEQEKPKAAKEFQKVEKKQKQKSKKQLEEAAMKAEANRQQQQMQQTQMRSARVAEGSSKQTKANTFASTTKENAWKKPDEPKSPPQQATLLDTFDSAATPQGSAKRLQSLPNLWPMSPMVRTRTSTLLRRTRAQARPKRLQLLDAKVDQICLEVKAGPMRSTTKNRTSGSRSWSRTEGNGSRSPRRRIRRRLGMVMIAVRPARLLLDNHQRSTAPQTNGTSRPEITNRFASVAVDDGEWEA